jgi:hypothetical protein
MKNITKKISICIVGLLVGFASCKDAFDQDPDLTATPGNFTANFMMINASPDAPALDFYVNNVLTGSPGLTTASGQSAYTAVAITSNNTFANTNIRAKATTGVIGGVLTKSDIIYRGSNAGTTNFQAANGASYTLIVVDTLNRPVPIRTLNSGNFGDITYYSARAVYNAKTKAGADTAIALTIGSNNSIVTGNLVKKYSPGGVFPSFFAPIGIVPLGSSDVGGPRFILLTDGTLPAGLPTPTAGKFAARFVHASPDLGAVTVTVGATSLTSGLFTYPLTQANFNPTVGSRSTTAAFANNFANSGIPYDITVKQGATVVATLLAQNFVDGGDYTIVLSGSFAKNTLKVVLVRNK